MTVLSATAIVVSRHRPELLQRCLRALGQQLFDSYEVVVVADFESLKSLEIDYPYKAIAFDEANISRARNLGIEQAAGDFVAFIDDDAVAEPTWLHHLALGFALPEVNAVGGYVRSRNGFSFQWKANCITPLGFSEPLEIAGVEPTVPPIPQGCAVKTEGTNCAFRREILSNIGGFDENIAFFHDETDLNMRMMKAGMQTAIAPLAQVHHGYAPSAQRGPGGAPKTLYQVGLSHGYFLRKHTPARNHEASLAQMRVQQKNRLLRFMVSGQLEPRDVARLLATLEAGFDVVTTLPIHKNKALTSGLEPFLAVTGAPEKSMQIAGRAWQKKSLRKQARALSKDSIVTQFRFSPTALPHHITFVTDGWWEHRGGVFGRSDRNTSYFRWLSFSRRISVEWSRLERIRFLTGTAINPHETPENDVAGKCSEGQ